MLREIGHIPGPELESVVYCCRHLTEVMLREIGHIPGPELEFAEYRES